MKFTHGGETYVMAQDRYDLGEVDDLETNIGIPYAEFTDPANSAVLQSTRATTVLQWVSARRKNPTLTLEQVRSWVLEDITFEDDPPDPTQPPSLGESVNGKSSTKATSPNAGTGPRKKSKA